MSACPAPFGSFGLSQIDWSFLEECQKNSHSLAEKQRLKKKKKKNGDIRKSNASNGSSSLALFCYLAPYLHCLLTGERGSLLGKEPPFSFHITITHMHSSRGGQYSAVYSSHPWVHLPSRLRLPTPSEALSPLGVPPHRARHQRARTLPVDALCSALRRG